MASYQLNTEIVNVYKFKCKFCSNFTQAQTCFQAHVIITQVYVNKTWWTLHKYRQIFLWPEYYTSICQQNLVD